MEMEFAQPSERVNSVDLHPTHPWILESFYSGSVRIWDYHSQTMLKSLKASDQPVRSAKFVARKRWVVAGADDKCIHVYDHDTMHMVKSFQAHRDYIRCVAVHPTLPCVLSSSDDMLIKMWDWDREWACTQIFEGHSHYVMQVAFNPRDPDAFASASLDGTAKIWSLGSPHPEFTLDGHERGVNCIDYFAAGDRLYLITASDDSTAKVWDYETKSCVQTLEGHTHNVSAVSFHPELPIIITASEYGTLRIWHSTTYRLSTGVSIRSVYDRLYNVWRITICLRRCVHDWRTRRGIFLSHMDGSVIYGLALHLLRRYAVSSRLLVFRLFLCFLVFGLVAAVCILVMQKPGVMLKLLK